ncbi:BglG family transcription antiterminator [Vagococcus elongatus]|uniref:Uncharacterized protein n=1 Tax=Vagococcus elongatus TaxID=180344 RepID=A0A430AMY3_9ENTE|nr:transcription antiterminator [Vagococcus elongatus]RSU09274.1 hypothetical protein CBF29_11850 [Vagococcus elongatus]
MYFSSREKKIINYMIDYHAGISVRELQQLLNVSKRTIYREIVSLEKTIQPLDIKIIKPRGRGYRLVGKEQDFKELKKSILEESPSFLDNIQRQSALTARLLVGKKGLSIDDIAELFEVSQTTVANDLDTIKNILLEYQLCLEKNSENYLRVIGEEDKRRQILTSLIYKEVTEFHFFDYLHQLEADRQEDHLDHYLLNVIDSSSLILAKNIILMYSGKVFSNVTDSQLQQVITILAVSIDRMVQGQIIDTPADEMFDVTLEVQGISRRILDFVQVEKNVTISKSEYHFLANQLSGINYKLPQNIFLKNFNVELSYHVREFVRLVSLESRIDFRQDTTLFYDLLAHLSAALQRNSTFIFLDNNLFLKTIIDEYHELYVAVKNSLKKVFSKIKFSQDELAYIVIHFATSLEKHSDPPALSVLVLCSNGIGTGKILKNRLLKNIPVIDKIKVAKLSEMKHLNFKEFDIILSTIFLPDFNLPYKIISPLLLDGEIQELKEMLQEKAVPHTAKIEKSADADFTVIYERMRIANNILENFRLANVEAEESLEQTLYNIVNELEDLVVRDVQNVTEAVIQRYKIAPLGVPGTNFALFHSANPWVKEPFFSIFHLDTSFIITGMDQQAIQLNRLLLMLAPDPMTLNEQTILGKISSSVIENDLSTETYRNGNQNDIYQLLSTLFINELKELD